MAGCGGVGAVGADHARHSRDCLAGSAVTPGRPARPGPAHPRRVRWPRAGGGERDHGRGGAGQPPPRHPVGWLLLVLGLSLAWGGVAPAYAAYGLLARPGALPAAHAVARYWPITVVTAQTALSFVLLLTPTGSLPSPRWRWWARVTAAAAIILLVGLVLASGPLDPRYQLLGGPFDLRGQGGMLLVVNQLALAFTTLAVVVGAASLVLRFRRATGVERQQLRWVAWAAALAVPGAVVALGGLAVGATALVYLGARCLFRGPAAGDRGGHPALSAL